MIELSKKLKIELNSKIYITEDWHDMLKEYTKSDEYPYEFQIIQKYFMQDSKDTYYICKGICKKNPKKVYKLAISIDVIRYIKGSEVPDTNIGFYFKDNLPIDNTDIIITAIRNNSNVQVGLFHSVVKEIETEDNGKFPLLDFCIDYKVGQGYTSISYYTKTQRATWKFLLNDDTSSMTDYEKMIQDTFIHKDLVENSCRKLARYLEDIGAYEHAKDLIERGIVHDNSKIMDEDELRALSSIINDQSSLTDATKSLSPLNRDFVKLHYKHNSHHPEHYKSCADMSRLDVMEMVCDWHARSIQKGTDLMEFVNKQHIPRYKFPTWMIPEILHYCEVLLRD